MNLVLDLHNHASGDSLSPWSDWLNGDDMQWVKREHGKKEIDRAGSALISWWNGEVDLPEPELGSFYQIIQNWRQSHGLPLNVFQAGLRARAKRVRRGEPIVAQRLKRFSSLMNKLSREADMKLSQMHDIGGCRAIMADVGAVNSLYRLYRDEEPLFEEVSAIKCYDYIRSPKVDGYRGIHIVGRYKAKIDSRSHWNGHRVEIQLRSRLQHAFSTTVETVTTFTQQPLKFGGGPSDWRRFFSLMGSALAIREVTPSVPGTPENERELIQELREATELLNVRQRLQGWTNTLKALPQKNIERFKWLLLAQDLDAGTVNVTGYRSQQGAARAIAIAEKAPAKTDAVLVWVKSFSDLRAAYPNYYADTREFMAALDSAISGKRR